MIHILSANLIHFRWCFHLCTCFYLCFYLCTWWCFYLCTCHVFLTSSAKLDIRSCLSWELAMSSVLLYVMVRSVNIPRTTLASGENNDNWQLEHHLVIYSSLSFLHLLLRSHDNPLTSLLLLLFPSTDCNGKTTHNIQYQVSKSLFESSTGDLNPRTAQLESNINHKSLLPPLQPFP